MGPMKKHLCVSAMKTYLVACALSTACLLASGTACALSSMVAPETAHADGQYTLEDIYGVNRAEVVRWLKSHENDAYYLGTPYRPYDWRSPNGDVNGYGAHSDGTSAGMNCTGFVWHALCAAHGWRDGIADRLPALNGWLSAIRNENLVSYTFSSKDEMLGSDVLEKGDVIWMWENGDPSRVSDNHHVAIFWGNRSDEDLMWHSSGDANNNWIGSNAKSIIHGKADRVTYQVVKLGGSLSGSFSLQKESSVPDISANNPNYRLQGAVYGLYASRQKAATHEARQAERTFSTDDTGSYASSDDVPVGTYYISEITPPRGFSLDASIYELDIQFDERARVNTANGLVSDAPITNPVTLWAEKHDAQTDSGKAQGAATLGGALFEITYYAGYYNRKTELPSPTRKWIVKTDENGKAWPRDDLKVSGDAFYRTASGQVTLPLGTVAVREAVPPEGYLGDDGSRGDELRLFLITADGVKASVTRYQSPAFYNSVIRGGVAIGKVDRQNGRYLAQGAATLEGATLSITSLNAQPVIVDGNVFEEGSVVATISTVRNEDGEFIASTSQNLLPYGIYELRETASCEGYLYDEASQDWAKRFEITEEGVLVDLTSPSDAVSNIVIRGDIAFSKADGMTGARLGAVPFLVTSTTTKERHVIVSDENGMVSTASSWFPRTGNVNANDNALLESDGEPVADDELLDPTAGIWFCGRADAACPPDDGLGALPFDTYTVEEVRCKANEGYELAAFDVRITRDSRELDMGTVDDNAESLDEAPTDGQSPSNPYEDVPNAVDSDDEELPKTFDGIPVALFVAGIVLAALGIAIARIAQRVKNEKAIVIERGAPRW